MFGYISSQIHDIYKNIYNKISSFTHSPKKLPPNIQSILTHKAKEAEDTLVKKPLRARSLSTPGTEVHFSEIKKRSGHLWLCVDRKPNSIKISTLEASLPLHAPGYIYKYELKRQYNDFSAIKYTDIHKKELKEKIREINPAVEPSGRDLLYLDSNLSQNELLEIEKTLLDQEMEEMPFESSPEELEEIVKTRVENKLKIAPILRELGYSCQVKGDEILLYLPDKEALTARWQMLQEKHPQFPDLDIISFPGIADDLTFIESLFHHDAILSTGIEFIHDHYAHIIPHFKLVVNSENNQTIKFEKAKLVFKAYQTIMLFKKLIAEGKIKVEDEKNLDILTAFTGGLADALSAHDNIDALAGQNYDTIIKDFLNIQLTYPNAVFHKNFEKRFGELQKDEILSFWEWMKEEVEKHKEIDKPKN